MVERIAQFLTEVTGTPVDNASVVAALVIVGLSILGLWFAFAWHRSEQRQWDEIRRLEEEEEDY